MHRIAGLVSFGAIITAASLAHAVSVTVESFDDWLPDSAYGSWPSGDLTQNPTNFGVQSKGFGGAYANIGDPFIINGTGTNTLQLSASVNAGVAGFLVALGDTTGHEWNYAWYGNVPGGGTGGSNDYVFTKPISAFNFSTGAAGPLDITNIDYIHIQVDPGTNPNLVYNVTYNDLSLIGGPANLTWNNTGATGDGTTWDVGTSQNWNSGSGPATFAQGDNASFTDTNNSHTAVNITGTVNPGSTTVNSSAAYAFNGTGSIGGSGGLTVSGTGSLTLNNNNTYTGATTVSSGSTLTVNGSLSASTALVANGNVRFGANAGSGILARSVASIALANGGKVTIAAPTSAANRSVLVTGGLTFGGALPAVQGVLDLGANDMIVRGGDIAAIRAQLHTGLGGTAGILSSATAASSSPKTAIGYAAITAAGTFDGQPVSSGDVVLKYTVLGDANLDAVVNFDDLLALAQHYGGSNGTWSTGDFTYDALTNFDDLLALAQNYGKTLSVGQASQVSSAFAADFALAVSLVPEPGTLSALSIGAITLIRRHRRCIK